MDLFWKVHPTRFISGNLAHANTHPKTPQDRLASVGCLVKAAQSFVYIVVFTVSRWRSCGLTPCVHGIKKSAGVEQIKRESEDEICFHYASIFQSGSWLQYWGERNDVNGAPNNSRIIDVRWSRILALIQDMLFIKRGLESTVHKQNTKRNTMQWQPVECLARVNLPMPQVNSSGIGKQNCIHIRVFECSFNRIRYNIKCILQANIIELDTVQSRKTEIQLHYYLDLE